MHSSWAVPRETRNHAHVGPTLLHSSLGARGLAELILWPGAVDAVAAPRHVPTIPREMSASRAAQILGESMCVTEILKRTLEQPGQFVRVVRDVRSLFDPLALGPFSFSQSGCPKIRQGGGPKAALLKSANPALPSSSPLRRCPPQACNRSTAKCNGEPPKPAPYRHPHKQMLAKQARKEQNIVCVKGPKKLYDIV